MIKKIIQAILSRTIRATFARKTEIHPDEAIVSFTFDDAPCSAFENGSAILKKYDYAATFYIALSFLNNEKSDVSFSTKQLKDCLAAQNELACHTFNHIHFQQSDHNEIEADLRKNLEKLQTLFPQQCFENFAYPYGGQSFSGRKLTRERFRSARSIQAGINRGKTDLNCLKAIKLYENEHSLEYIYQQLHNAEQSKGWLIFYTHDIQENYSAYGCSPHYFEAVVKRCFESNLQVAPINQALRLTAPQ